MTNQTTTVDESVLPGWAKQQKQDQNNQRNAAPAPVPAQLPARKAQVCCEM
jgi:hypothetical protein